MQYETSIISDEIIRHCPKCNEIIHYKDKGSLLRANNKNSVCKKCNYNRPKNLGPFIRNCPCCNKKLEYSRIDIYKISEKQNVLCKSCGQKRRIHPPEFSKKMSLIYKNSSPEMKIKRMGMLGKRHKNSTLEKMSQSNSISVAKAWKDPIKRKNMLDRNKWDNHSVDKGSIELIEKWNKLGFKFKINYQVKDHINLFYLDGYDPIHNVIFEYDSKYHNSPSQKEKDLTRQEKIIKILNPKKFWRYNAINKKYRNVIERTD